MTEKLKRRWLFFDHSIKLFCVFLHICCHWRFAGFKCVRKGAHFSGVTKGHKSQIQRGSSFLFSSFCHSCFSFSFPILCRCSFSRIWQTEFVAGFHLESKCKSFSADVIPWLSVRDLPCLTPRNILFQTLQPWQRCSASWWLSRSFRHWSEQLCENQFSVWQLIHVSFNTQGATLGFECMWIGSWLACICWWFYIGVAHGDSRHARGCNDTHVWAQNVGDVLASIDVDSFGNCESQRTEDDGWVEKMLWIWSTSPSRCTEVHSTDQTKGLTLRNSFLRPCGWVKIHDDLLSEFGQLRGTKKIVHLNTCSALCGIKKWPAGETKAKTYIPLSLCNSFATTLPKRRPWTQICSALYDSLIEQKQEVQLNLFQDPSYFTKTHNLLTKNNYTNIRFANYPPIPEGTKESWQ